MPEAALFPVRLTPSGDEILCPEDRTILDGFILAGIPVPYNCRSGECGECMANLTSGKVHEMPGADPAMFTDKDRARGNVLMCMCFPRSAAVLNVSLSADTDAIRPSTFNVTVRRVEALTPTIYGVTVETPWPIEFHAGQNFEWIIPGVTPNRTYSAANSPGTDVIDFHVRVYPGGKAGEFVSQLSTGRTFSMNGPFGHFGFSANQWRPCVCVAGGTGLAPILSILDAAFAKGDTRPIKLLYGARTQADLYRLDQLTHWCRTRGNFTFIPVLSHEPEGSAWTGARGLVTESLSAELGDAFGLEAYVCGPPAMIDATVDLLERAGVASEDVRTDRFSQVKN